MLTEIATLRLVKRQHSGWIRTLLCLRCKTSNLRHINFLCIFSHLLRTIIFLPWCHLGRVAKWYLTKTKRYGVETCLGNWPECSTQNERRQVWCRTFRSKKFALNVRHHFHAWEYFIIKAYFSVKKMYDEFPFVPWPLPPLERHERRKFLLVRTLKAKFDH